MKNSKLTIFKFLLFFIIIFTFTNNDQSYAHLIDGKKHKKITCKPFEKRGKFKQIYCKNIKKRHKLCKEDVHCALIKLEEQEKQIGKQQKEIIDQEKANKELEKKLEDTTICVDIAFNHKTSQNSKIYRKPNSESKIVVEVKKEEELLFISPSIKNKKWYFVLTRKGNKCNSGYIQQKFVVKEDADDGDIKIKQPIKVIKSEIISIISPEWIEKGKLIVVKAPGIQTIRGWVDENKIDEVIVDEKARPIQSNGTFSFNVFIKKDAKEIRITGNKNGKKVQSLIFKIRVGN